MRQGPGQERKVEEFSECEKLHVLAQSLGGGDRGKDLTTEGRILRGGSRRLSKVFQIQQEGEELVIEGQIEERSMRMFLLMEAVL